jgi:hypothetical protein
MRGYHQMTESESWPQMHNPFSGITGKNHCGVPNMPSNPTSSDVINKIAGAMDGAIPDDNIRGKCDKMLASMPDVNNMNSDTSEKPNKSELEKLLDNGYKVMDKNDDGHWSEVRREGPSDNSLLLG